MRRPNVLQGFRPLPPSPPPYQAAMDFRADPMLYEACKDDSASLCKDTKNGGGRIQACLVRGGECRGGAATSRPAW